MLVILSKIA